MSRDLTQEEEDLIKKMGDDNAPLVMKDVRCPGAYLRPQHGKSHGCLKARFTVRADLAPEFRKGIFIPGKAYDGVARFSAGVQFDDSQDDAHGLALKLDGVNPDGAQAWANDAAREAGVQDFVMMNRDTFPFYDFKSYERINDVMCANFLANRASMSDNEFENFWGQLRGYSEMAADPVKMYLNDIFTVTVNMAGLPGIAVPAGLDSAGLPLGLQLIGKPFEEETLFKAGTVIEQAAGRFAPEKWW